MECTSNEVTSMSFTINEGLGVILDDGLVHDLVNSGAFSGQGACSRPGRPCWGPALPLQVLHVVLLHSKNAKDKVWHAWCKLTVTSGKIQSKEKTKNRQIREKGPSWCDDLQSTEIHWNGNKICLSTSNSTTKKPQEKSLQYRLVCFWETLNVQCPLNQSAYRLLVDLQSIGRLWNVTVRSKSLQLTDLEWNTGLMGFQSSLSLKQGRCSHPHYVFLDLSWILQLFKSVMWLLWLAVAQLSHHLSNQPKHATKSMAS